MADDKKRPALFLLDPDKLLEVFHSNIAATLAEFYGDTLDKDEGKLVDAFMRVNGMRLPEGVTVAPGDDPYNRLLRMFVNKATYGALGRINEEDEKRWEEHAHPANFDLPVDQDDLNTWSFLHYLSKKMKAELDRKHDAGEKIEFQVNHDIAGFLVNALPPATLRDAVHKLQLNGNRVGGDANYQAEVAFDILKAQQEYGIRKEYVDADDNIIPTQAADDQDGDAKPAQRIENVLDFIASLPDFVAEETKNMGPIRSLHDLISRPKQDGSKQRETIRMALQGNARLKPQTVDVYRKISPEHILKARKAAIYMALAMDAKKVVSPHYLRPSYMYNVMFEQDPAKHVYDPIALAWAAKLLHEEHARAENKANGTRKKVRITLAEAWKKMDWATMPGAKKPKNSARILTVLAQIDALNLPIYSLHDVARSQLAEPAANADTVADVLAKKREFAARILEGRIKPSALWSRATKAKDSPLVPSTELAEFCNVFGIADARLIMPPEILSTPAAAAVLPPATPAAAVPPALPAAGPAEQAVIAPQEPETPKQKTAADLTPEALVDGAAALLGANAAQRKLLEEALHRPAVMADLPSLPHVWMMWAANPQTRMMSTRNLVAAFQDFWNIPASQRISYEGTAKQQFIWSAVATMHNTGALFDNYRDFVARVSVEAGTDASKAPSVPTILNALNIDALKQATDTVLELEGLDAINAKQVVKWIDSLPVPQSLLFGGRYTGSRYLGRLRQAAGSPKAPQAKLAKPKDKKAQHG